MFTTKDGEVINTKQSLFNDHTALFIAIRKYNIFFRNEEELKETEDVYSIDEVNKMIEEAKNITVEYAGNLIRDKFGPEYDIDLRIIDEAEYINMYLRLAKEWPWEYMTNGKKYRTVNYNGREYSIKSVSATSDALFNCIKYDFNLVIFFEMTKLKIILTMLKFIL